jgi:DNA-binding PadR family transcriptional regulator
MNTRALDRELKRGSAELLILSLLDARPRHGYELSKLIHARSGGLLTFHIDSLYPLLYRLEERGWIKGAWVEKAGERRRRFYKVTARGTPRAGRAAKDVGCIRGSRAMRHARRTCLTPRFLRTRCRSGGPIDSAERGVAQGALTGEVRARLASHLSPTREIEIIDELSQHPDDRCRDLTAGGASPEEAKRLALVDFRSGNVPSTAVPRGRQAGQSESTRPARRRNESWRQGLSLTATGIALGIGVAVVLTRVMSAFLFSSSLCGPTSEHVLRDQGRAEARM